jgi:hypothetical protein
MAAISAIFRAVQAVMASESKERMPDFLTEIFGRSNPMTGGRQLGADHRAMH